MERLLPFLMVFVGILLSTLVPLAVKNLKLLRDGKKVERFQKKYLVAPLAMIFSTCAIGAPDGIYLSQADSCLPWSRYS